MNALVNPESANPVANPPTLRRATPHEQREFEAGTTLTYALINLHKKDNFSASLFALVAADKVDPVSPLASDVVDVWRFAVAQLNPTDKQQATGYAKDHSLLGPHVNGALWGITTLSEQDMRDVRNRLAKRGLVSLTRPTV